MSEQTFSREFVERFKAQAPGYPQPVMDFHPAPGKPERFDLAWPDKRIAVELGGESVFQVTGWTVYSIVERAWSANPASVIEAVAELLDA